MYHWFIAIGAYMDKRRWFEHPERIARRHLFVGSQTLSQKNTTCTLLDGLGQMTRGLDYLLAERNPLAHFHECVKLLLHACTL